jgi:hypothetical protein
VSRDLALRVLEAADLEAVRRLAQDALVRDLESPKGDWLRCRGCGQRFPDTGVSRMQSTNSLRRAPKRL